MSLPALYHMENVGKEYDGRAVLLIDRLDIREGEILGLVGPTGAGKSTLLRLLAFLEDSTVGRIHYRGQPRNDATLPLALRREISMVFQQPLLSGDSVQANVEQGLRLRGIRDAAGRVNRLLERTGMTRLAKRSARRLSGGETQLVAIARALAVEPRVLLLDEPTAHLDPARVGLVEDILKEFHTRFQATLVIATHNLFQARRLADRVALLLDGRLVEIADTATFFTNPRDDRTRAFVEGKMVY
jgi:tungstate transport system ATP-binding protein